MNTGLSSNSQVKRNDIFSLSFSGIYEQYLRVSSLFSLSLPLQQDSGFGDDRNRRVSASSSGSAASNLHPLLSSTLGSSANGKENASPNKHSRVSGGSGSGARKSLAANWTPASILNPADASSFTNPETPSKSLIGADNSGLFSSPPSILKESNFTDDSGNFDEIDSSLLVGDKTPSHAASSSVGTDIANGGGGSSASGGSQPPQQPATHSNNGGAAAGTNNSPPKSKVSLRLFVSDPPPPTDNHDYMMMPPDIPCEEMHKYLFDADNSSPFS